MAAFVETVPIILHPQTVGYLQEIKPSSVASLKDPRLETHYLQEYNRHLVNAAKFALVDAPVDDELKQMIHRLLGGQIGNIPIPETVPERLHSAGLLVVKNSYKEERSTGKSWNTHLERNGLQLTGYDYYVRFPDVRVIPPKTSHARIRAHGRDFSEWYLSRYAFRDVS